jgi:hypothetical protein
MSALEGVSGGKPHDQMSAEPLEGCGYTCGCLHGINLLLADTEAGLIKSTDALGDHDLFCYFLKQYILRHMIC